MHKIKRFNQNQVYRATVRHIKKHKHKSHARNPATRYSPDWYTARLNRDTRGRRQALPQAKLRHSVLR